MMEGDERSPQSRMINNSDRSKKINSLKKHNFYDSDLTYKPKTNQTQNAYHTLESIMSEKVRIRSRRNQEAGRKGSTTQRNIATADLSTIDI